VQFDFEQVPKKCDLETYLRREAKSAHKHAFINGQIIRMPNTRGPHNIIATNFTIELGMLVRMLEKDCVIFNSDQKIYLPKLDECVYADALAVAEAPQYWDKGQLLLTNPRIVVEVLSKRTEKYDKSGKFDKYKTLDDFQEYVLIRQDKCYAEVWYRYRAGWWQETILENLEDHLVLQSMGVSIPLKAIYRSVNLPI
jgi:Uma2 family endonuclease